MVIAVVCLVCSEVVQRRSACNDSMLMQMIKCEATTRVSYCKKHTFTYMVKKNTGMEKQQLTGPLSLSLPCVYSLYLVFL